MTYTYLKMHRDKARTVFNKAFDLQKMAEKNFGLEHEISLEALGACSAAHRVYEALEHKVKTHKRYSEWK